MKFSFQTLLVAYIKFNGADRRFGRLIIENNLVLALWMKNYRVRACLDAYYFEVKYNYAMVAAAPTDLSRGRRCPRGSRPPPPPPPPRISTTAADLNLGRRRRPHGSRPPPSPPPPRISATVVAAPADLGRPRGSWLPPPADLGRRPPRISTTAADLNLDRRYRRPRGSWPPPPAYLDYCHRFEIDSTTSSLGMDPHPLGLLSDWGRFKPPPPPPRGSRLSL
uniref:Uncharacterized protein n=1 Tax=Ananas comosus var. bracteatus TaxID=296719 RepID=A0A6V7PYX6_ANACO|nr:unnamed protein product [Ananas comosus var. bracteatus]